MNLNPATPVLLIEGSYGALGIVRSLGRLGVPVYVADTHLRGPAVCSRYCRGALCCDVEASPSTALALIVDLARRVGRRMLLIPTGDSAAQFVANNADVLSEWFMFQRQPADLVDALCSKKRMYELAIRHGVPTPETLFPQTYREVEEFAKTAKFPVMLKAIDGGRLYKRARAKMFVVHSSAELLARYAEVEDQTSPNLMLQQYIPGGDDSVWMFNGCFDSDSACMFGIVGRKLRQCPVGRGVTSLGVVVDEPAVYNTTVRWMKALGYHGILDIGYRFDPTDRLFKVLDVNPRIGATFRLFTDDRNNDVARIFYAHMTGQTLETGEPCYGRKWGVEDLDLASSFRHWRAGDLTAASWLRSFSGVKETAYWALDDVRPAIRRLVTDISLASERLAPHRQEQGRMSTITAPPVVKRI